MPSRGVATGLSAWLAAAALSVSARAASAPDPACKADGCLRRASKVGDYGKAELAPYLAPGVSIDNGYSVWVIAFATRGREALAAITVPYGVKAPRDGWHVVVNSHGTTGVGDACAVVGTVAGTGLAGTFGARGMVGVALDYPGLGTPGPNPYLVSEVEGPAVLDALRAARAFAAAEKVPLSGRFAAVGMSQGGHATLAAAAIHRSHAPDLDIRAFAVAAPVSAWESLWRSAIVFDGSHVAYHALLMHAWSTHYGHDGPGIWAAEHAATIGKTMEDLCAWSPRGEKVTLLDRLGSRADKVFSKGFLRAYRSGTWGEYATFHDWFEKNAIRPFPQTAPLRVYQGDADLAVPEITTRELVAALEKGGVDVDYQVVPGGGHLDVAFGFVASRELRTDDSIAWLRARLDAPAGAR